MEESGLLPLPMTVIIMKQSFCFWKRKKSSEVAQKEEVTLGTLWLDDNVKSAIIDFNKSSDKYHISVKTYGQDDWESGLTQFNADVASGSGPDLVDFSNLNYTLYAEKGVFEDLYPYMEKERLKEGELR